MKIVQTLWTGFKDEHRISPIDIKAGWPSCEYHWMSWALSCLQAKSFFNEVELVTDDLGKEILIDRLGLPYTNVSASLEGLLDAYPSHVWALAKIFSYSIQKKPFLHIDSDVFLWQKPDEQLLSSGIIAQNLEKNLFFYKETLDKINEHFTFIPDIYASDNYKDKDLFASNAGLIGGCNIDFFSQYCKNAFEFIDGNRQHLHKVATSNMNFIFEQYALYYTAKKRQADIEYYLDDIIDTPVYENFIRFQDYPFVKMVHPVGGFKMYPHVCDHLAKMLRNNYPDWYYKIIKMVREEPVSMKNKIYHLFMPGTPGSSADATAVPAQRLDNNTAYERTIEAAKYFKVNNEFFKIISDADFKIEEFTGSISTYLPSNNIQYRDMLIELYGLEHQKKLLFNQVFLNKDTLTSLYEDDIQAYKACQDNFSLPLTNILELKVSTAPFTKAIELGWTWKYAHKDYIKPLLEKNCSEDSSFNMVVLIPNALRVMVDEYYLDQLDMIIIDAVKKETTIHDIINSAAQYFNSEEINNNRLAFHSLIIDSVKRLAYAGILEI